MTGPAGGGELPLLAATPRIPTHVVFRVFARETVVLNLKTGKYHGLNPTGGRILEVLRSSASIGDAARSLATEYERPLEEMQRDVCAFCSDLLVRELIELAA